MKNSIPNNSNISTSSNPQHIGDITFTTSTQLLEEMMKLVPKGPFVPYSFYNEDMDAIQLYFKNDECYTQPLTESMNLYISFDTDQVVGVKIMNVKKLLEKKISP